MARVLAAEEMVEEARAAVTSAIHEMGRALAVEHRRQPEPANARGAVAPPLDTFWPGGDFFAGGCWERCGAFSRDENAAVHPTIAALGQPNETGARLPGKGFLRRHQGQAGDDRELAHRFVPRLRSPISGRNRSENRPYH